MVQHRQWGRLSRPLGAFVAGGLWLGVAQAQDEGSGSVPSGTSGAILKKPEEAPEVAKPVVVPPELLEFAQAAYPKEAEQQGLQAEVVLLLTVDEKGKVVEAVPSEPKVGNGFDEAAAEAALRFVFRPATVNGEPRLVKIKYLYRFVLTEVVKEVAAPATTGNLTGRLTIAGTDIALAGATVRLKTADGKEVEVRSDSDGRFLFAELPPGPYTVSVESPGFVATTQQEEVTVGQETDVTYRIEPQVEGEVVRIEGEKPPREVTKRTLERREISRIPGTGGDALRSIQSLPGVARPPGLAGLLIVRGSSPNDTATFVNGSEVPLIYHFGGLSSTIPTELLERIDFYPGNFSARYGRYMGGIVDVGLRSPDTECRDVKGEKVKGRCFHGLAQLDLIDARFLLEGPINEDWSFAVAGRRSWIDSWLKPVLESAGTSVTSAPVYYDYQAIAERRFSKDAKLSLRWFGSDDRFEALISDPASSDPAFGGNIRFGTAGHQLQAQYQAKLAKDFELTAMSSVSRNTIDFSLGSFLFNLKTYPIQGRAELAWAAFRGAKMFFGLDYQGAPYEVEVVAPPPPQPGEPDPGPYASKPPLEAYEKATAFRPGWYAEMELHPSDRSLIVPGIRADYARDTDQLTIDPRISGRYDLIKGGETSPGSGKLRRRTTVKGGVGLYSQPPDFQQTNAIFGTPGVDANRAIHYSVGVERELTDQMEVGVEGFYKDMQNLVVRQPDASGNLQYQNTGSGDVLGLETLLKYKPDDRFFGWVAYTLSKSTRKDCDSCEERLFEYDQTHNLTALGSYRLGRGWEFGARFRLISGSLYTPAARKPSLPGVYSADGSAYAAIQGEPNSERLPLFHQLDLRVDKRWQFTNWRLSTYLDVQNAYNNAAYEGLSYNYNFSQETYNTGLPIIPSLGMRGEF